MGLSSKTLLDLTSRVAAVARGHGGDRDRHANACYRQANPRRIHIILEDLVTRSLSSLVERLSQETLKPFITSQVIADHAALKE